LASNAIEGSKKPSSADKGNRNSRANWQTLKSMLANQIKLRLFGAVAGSRWKRGWCGGGREIGVVAKKHRGDEKKLKPTKIDPSKGLVVSKILD